MKIHCTGAGVEVVYLFLLPSILLLLARQDEVAEFVDVAVEFLSLMVFDVPDLVAYRTDEMTIVTYHNHASLERSQSSNQSLDGVCVLL